MEKKEAFVRPGKQPTRSTKSKSKQSRRGSHATLADYSLLKRPDEKEVTERAFDHPVFVEDLVRNVALRSDAHEAITWYRVEAENFESIHNHNAYALIEKHGNAGR